MSACSGEECSQDGGPEAPSLQKVTRRDELLDGISLILYRSNMKTIAVTIDEDTLCSIDGLLAAPSGPWKSRSQLVREALQEFVRKAERHREEAHEAAVFHEHRDRLGAQARALIAEQAEP